MGICFDEIMYYVEVNNGNFCYVSISKVKGEYCFSIILK